MKKLALVLVALSFFARTARADDPPKKKKKEEPTLEAHGLFSMPLLLGVDTAITDTTTGTGFFCGVRPEYIRAWATRDGLGFGVGPYIDLAGSTGTSQLWLGGGLTAVGYFGHLGVAASGGIDSDWFHSTPYASPVVGLFVGFRTPVDGGNVDFPFGVRVDLRPSTSALMPTTVIVSAQIDIFVAFTVGFLYAMTAGLRN
jgi:hypothetical protein